MPETNAESKRGRGRPAKGSLPAHFHVKSSRKYKEFVRSLASKRGLSESAFITEAITFYVHSIGEGPTPDREEIEESLNSGVDS